MIIFRTLTATLYPEKECATLLSLGSLEQLSLVLHIHIISIKVLSWYNEQFKNSFFCASLILSM